MKLKPYWTSANGQHAIYLGDCLDIMPKLKAESVDAVITDPPYGVKIALWDSDMPPQSILTESKRIATGTIAWFGAASKVLDFAKYNPQPDRIIVWNPSFALGRCQSKGFVFSWHPIALWQPQQHGGHSLDVLRHPADGRNWWNHPGTKPIALMITLCEMLSNEIVLDPFMGSGTTGVACVRLGKKFIGIEINQEYCDIAIKRLNQELSKPRFMQKKFTYPKLRPEESA